MAEGANAGYSDHADADGLETVDAWECVGGCPVRALGEQSGECSGLREPARRTTTAIWGNGKQPGVRPAVTDSGTAARFFFQADWSAEVAEQIAAADPVRYQAKAARSERDAGLEGMALSMTSAMAGRRDSHDMSHSKIDNDVTARFVTEKRNLHPTVKPIALCRWLATLLLPPAEYGPRRILVPFAGSGSECIGAMQAGWEEVVGIEKEAEYVEIAEARLAHWGQQPSLPLHP